MTRYAVLAVAVSALTAQPWARPGAATLPLDAETKLQIPYADARPILEALRPNLPSELATTTPAELESAWPGWVSRRDVEIRRRLGSPLPATFPTKLSSRRS